MNYIIAQSMGIIAFVISLVAYHRDTKEKILGNMVLSSVLNLIHYFMLGAFSGCITKVVAILRDSFVIIKNKNKFLSSNLFLLIFFAIYLMVGILTYTSIWSVFPIIAAVIYIIPIWNGNEITIKKTAFLCYFLWLIYNVCVFSIAGIISNIVSIISTFIAVKNANNSSGK